MDNSSLALTLPPLSPSPSPTKSLKPVGGHSFSSSLPMELMLEICETFLLCAPKGQRRAVLLLCRDLTKGLYPFLYAFIRVRTFRAIRSLYWSLLRTPELCHYIKRLEFRFPDVYPYGTRAAFRANLIDTKSEIVAWQIHILRMCSRFVRQLVLRIGGRFGGMHPMIIHCLRTVTFPNLRFLDSSYCVVLDEDHTTRFYDKVRKVFRNRGEDVCRITTLSRRLIINHWSSLTRLCVHIDAEEVFAEHPLSTTLSHLPSIRELSLAFRTDACQFYLDFLEKFQVPDGVAACVIVMHYCWSVNSTLFAPFPPASYNYHPKLLFASKEEPYFFAEAFPAPRAVRHLNGMTLIYNEVDTWDGFWTAAIAKLFAKPDYLEVSDQTAAIVRQSA
ncbi:hypothetical protein VNI00_010700 [Paramarasmius palmivorus]|uniref:F-box domain-containing protein n=1 Tax=Paramarasmius palmivorus TaxID=297713 RepID=A0AAW0CF52_9AGAR